MNKELESRIEKARNPEKAKLLQRFFKTGKGQYGEGDIFYGIMVPIQRMIAKEFKDILIDDIQELLDSQVHEKRLISLLILIKQYERGVKEKNEDKRALLEKDFGEKRKKEIFDLYLKNAEKGNINNWDLVDLSAPNIVGNYLLDKDRKILYVLAKSKNLWERRISILSTAAFIRQGEFDDTLKISEMLMNDSHDLIHKAVGWMLREVGKRDEKILCDFLQKHYKNMPRTMLRYAIEKFPEKERKKWLKVNN